METPPQAPTGPSGPRAGFFRRFFALLLDDIIVGIVTLVVAAVLGRGVANTLGLVLFFLYFGYLEGSPSGQTVGKRVLGIRVIDFRTGGPIGFGRGLLRYLGKIISSIPCLLGFLWMLWDREKQAWDDKIANTVVVPVADYPVESWPG